MDSPSEKSPAKRINGAYAVVLTIDSPKANSLNIHIVPTHWIVDNVLFYPPDIFGKTAIDGLIKAGQHSSIDKKKWRKYACIIKKTFKAYDTADKYFQSSSVTEDTDETDDANLKALQKKQMKKSNTAREY